MEVEVDLLDIDLNCEKKNYYSYIMIIFLLVISLQRRNEDSTKPGKRNNG